MMNRIFKRELLPRIVYLPYLLAKSVLLFFSVVHRLTGRRQSRSSGSKLCIEAGVKGWESIEFKELYQSAVEYLQPEDVLKLIVKPEQSYVQQVAEVLGAHSITHYLYDPRTGNQSLWPGLWQSLRIALLLQKNDVVPVVFLTDLSVRTWRSQSAVVSARRGLVVCFMAPRRVGPIFPHRRLLGPNLMPFSVKTKHMLDALIEQKPQDASATALFAGSLYEPRTTVLEKIRSGLAERGLVFQVKGRVVGSARVTDHEYWARLCHSDIIVTTADQMIQDGTDWTDIPHLVYRYLEVLASGALLVAQDVPSVRRFFTPGEHFVTFDSAENAIDVISFYLGNVTDRERIARKGKERADVLIYARAYWMLVDASLATDSLI
jgi:hypothetical protein